MLNRAGRSLCLTPTTSTNGELNSFPHGQNRGMLEAVAFHPSFVPVNRSMIRCELYAKKQRVALRQKLPAIRQTQLTVSATKTAAAKLWVKPW